MTRDETWERLTSEAPWDLVVVGGGITGAGILREAVKVGLKAVLLEQKDFAWGTSSRSSKLVHGGLRYLKEGRVLLTRHSVQERERLLTQGRGLVYPIDFLFSTYAGEKPGRFLMGAGLVLYDVLAGRRNHRHVSTDELKALAPGIETQHLDGGLCYGDAGTDDSRLVLRVLREAVRDGGTVLNYAPVEGLLREGGRVVGVAVRDAGLPAGKGRTAEVAARAVVNATGVWVDGLRKLVGGKPRMRPLRGSHLVFRHERLPVHHAVTVLHPQDFRPVFLIPWEGVTLLGTTDVDHAGSLGDEPAISGDETAYLMEILRHRFPSLQVSAYEAISSFAGVRPVVGSGKKKPSQESRDHVIWEENGLVTVTGGKLTTFRLIARDALSAVHHLLPQTAEPPRDIRVLDDPGEPPELDGLTAEDALRLLGRYGQDLRPLAAAARPGELEGVAGSVYRWAELRFAARHEWVVRLEDLLLRRVRLGLVLPDGGHAALARVRAICKEELGWSEARYKEEERRYLELIRTSYAAPTQRSTGDALEAAGKAGAQPPEKDPRPAKPGRTRARAV